jgi:hypothetical protein
LPSATRRARQTLSAVTEQGYDGWFAECRAFDTRQRMSLCRVSDERLSAKEVPLPSVRC